jgi:hypothetical protein
MIFFVFFLKIYRKRSQYMGYTHPSASWESCRRLDWGRRRQIVLQVPGGHQSFEATGGRLINNEWRHKPDSISVLFQTSNASTYTTCVYVNLITDICISQGDEYEHYYSLGYEFIGLGRSDRNVAEKQFPVNRVQDGDRICLRNIGRGLPSDITSYLLRKLPSHPSPWECQLSSNDSLQRGYFIDCAQIPVRN